MASTPVSAGSIIKPSSNGLNDLFSRIEALRSQHYTATANAGGNTSAISSAFSTRVSAGQTAQAATVSTLKSNIDAVASSTSFVNNKGSVSTAISVPSVGTLLSAGNFNAWNTVITNMEGVCAHYSRYSGRYDSHYGGHYSSHYGHYSGKYDHYGAKYDHYGAKYGHYSSHYGHYSSRYGHYSSRGCIIDSSLIYGSNKQIKQLINSDYIYSYNQILDKYEKDKIIKISNHDNISKFIEITLEDNSTIKITDSHPILTTDGWKSLDPYGSIQIHGVYTTLLKIGDYIKCINNNLKIIDISWKYNIDNSSFCNITTSKNHNFLITLNNNNAAIIHNVKVCRGMC